MPAIELSVVVPAYNEEKRLPSTLARLAADLDEVVGPKWEVIISDDGSRDRTAEIAQAQAAIDERFRVIRGGRNLGKGAALRAGVRSARHEIAALVDADLPVPVTTLATMTDHIGRADLVVGSRRLPGSAIENPQPLVRRVGGWGFIAATRALGFAPSSDPQCGTKVVRRDTILPILDEVTCEGFAFDIEMVTRARLAGLSVVDVPVRWTHVEGSSVRPVRDALQTLSDLNRLRRHLARSQGAGPDDDIS